MAPLSPDSDETGTDMTAHQESGAASEVSKRLASRVVLRESGAASEISKRLASWVVRRESGAASGGFL